MTHEKPNAIARVQLRIPLPLQKKLFAFAKNEGRSVNNLMRRILEAACTKAEEQVSKPLEDRKND